jgi:hypothetical protein
MLVLRNLVHDLKSVATDQTEEELTGVGLGWLNSGPRDLLKNTLLKLVLCARQEHWC